MTFKVHAPQQIWPSRLFNIDPTFSKVISSDEKRRPGAIST
jgi:hypothetical protein